jgi:hypothetical protein
MDGMPPPASVDTSALASPQAVLDLAGNYRAAADHLFAAFRNGNRQFDLPARLCALHAVELYLHAFLRFRGVACGHIKARHHNLWHEEFCHRLELDAKTSQHLKDLSENREYRAVRYPDGQQARLSQTNRMARTLGAIREKADRIPFDA